MSSSSSIDSAKKFISEIVDGKQELNCSAYGSYEELVKDEDVDLIYVATPHSHHYQNVRLCLDAGKPVLCEKAFTVTADQAKILYKLAKEKNLFLMEAVWTRYFPLSIYVRETIESGKLGEVLQVIADNSIGSASEDFDLNSRMVKLELAGGALLDLGIYSLTWVFQTLWHTLKPELQTDKPKVVGSILTPEPRTGVDEHTTMLLEFPKSTPGGKHKSHAVATTSFRLDDNPDKKASAGPAVRIRGEKGELQVFGPVFRPSRTKLVMNGKEGGQVDEKTFDFPGDGHGMFWEADEAARCWRDKKLESKGMTWDESTLIMETMDEVRRQGGLDYPQAIRTTDYPVNLRAKGL